MVKIKYIKIKSIKEIGVHKTYDIIVDDKFHNFLLKNNLLSHNSQDLTLLGRIAATSKRDRAEIAESLASVGKMTRLQIQNLSELRSGEFFLIEGYKDVRKVYFLLPRSMYWQEGDGNFCKNVWKKYVDKWTNIKIDKEIITKIFKEDNIKLIEERKFKNELEKQKKQKRKDEKVKVKKAPKLEESPEEDNNENEDNENKKNVLYTDDWLN